MVLLVAFIGNKDFMKNTFKWLDKTASNVENQYLPQAKSL
jgi:hypothetical protein